MRIIKLSIVVGLVLLLSLPLFADTWEAFKTPGSSDYLTTTTNYGGGDGSGGMIGLLGPFDFVSPPWKELSVPSTWPTWNSPPWTESSTPNVLLSPVAGLSIDLIGIQNTAGFELEPSLFQVETVWVQFLGTNGHTFTITQSVNGDRGALLFAARDATAGASIYGINIADLAGDTFAIAELRSGTGPITPEPGTLALLGTGVLGLAGFARRKFNL